MIFLVKSYLQNNDVTYTHYINLVEDMIRQQTLCLTCRESATVALSYHVKIRELLTSGIIFVVSRFRKGKHGKYKHNEIILRL